MIKLLSYTGAFLLILMVALYSNATTRSASVPAYVSYGVSGCQLLTTASSHLFTNIAGSCTARIRSANGTAHGIYSNSWCSTPAYFRPF